MSIITALIVFLLGGVFGWLFERVAFGKETCNVTLKRLTGHCVPFLVLWAGCALALYALRLCMPSLSVGWLALLGALIITVIECIVGKTQPGRPWNYDDLPLPFCDGYTCVPVSIGWFVLALLFFILIQKCETLLS